MNKIYWLMPILVTTKDELSQEHIIEITEWYSIFLKWHLSRDY